MLTINVLRVDIRYLGFIDYMYIMYACMLRISYIHLLRHHTFLILFFFKCRYLMIYKKYKYYIYTEIEKSVNSCFLFLF